MTQLLTLTNSRQLANQGGLHSVVLECESRHGSGHPIAPIHGGTILTQDIASMANSVLLVEGDRSIDGRDLSKAGQQPGRRSLTPGSGRYGCDITVPIQD
ncbi:MAG: hypothetical protein HC769_32840 [Cyanobacteria bacterium CRU_2_1]|nr:hypothetical protein [Cyanobacteria bacterium RU_5_0]NJR63150.1 hypothetical protein [Cyanobacteria bacterium CRU_2_1]